VRQAVPATALSLAMVAAALSFGATAPLQTLLLGGVLVSSSAAFAYLGRDPGRVVLPALLLGTLPLGCALVARHFGHWCASGACYSICAQLCSAAGLCAGVLLTRLTQSEPKPMRSWLLGATITGVSGALGCACLSATALGGMLLGLFLPQLVRVSANLLRQTSA
jgi:hypothetical protein